MAELRAADLFVPRCLGGMMSAVYRLYHISGQIIHASVSLRSLINYLIDLRAKKGNLYPYIAYIDTILVCIFHHFLPFHPF